jgi:biotin operon repressor
MRRASLGDRNAIRQDHAGLVTSSSDDLLGFIGASFRSVWALELLLLLKREPRLWSRAELISTLRASELVVNKAIEELVAAGFVTVEGDGARYVPVSDDIARRMKQVDKLYSARPNAVRRAIISATASGATAFADAFRLRKD